MMINITKNITTVNKTVMTGKVNKYIVIHYTGNQTDTAAGNANYFKSVNRGASAHYFVDDTSIYQVVEDKDSAWAVGKNYGSNNLFGVVTNRNSISIEMCSKNGKISDTTLKNTIELTQFLMKKYNIPASNVCRHYDVCSKRCPGWAGWLPGDESIWNDFKKRIAAAPSKDPAPASALPYKAVATQTIPIREHSRKDSDKVGVKEMGASCTIVQEKNGFGLLKKYAEGKNGWVNLKYIKKV